MTPIPTRRGWGRDAHTTGRGFGISTEFPIVACAATQKLPCISYAEHWGTSRLHLLSSYERTAPQGGVAGYYRDGRVKMIQLKVRYSKAHAQWRQAAPRGLTLTRSAEYAQLHRQLRRSCRRVCQSPQDASRCQSRSVAWPATPATIEADDQSRRQDHCRGTKAEELRS